MVTDPLTEIIAKELAQPFIQASNFISNTAHQLGNQFSNYLTGDPRDLPVLIGVLTYVAAVCVACPMWVRYQNKKEDLARQAGQKTQYRG